MRDGTLRKTEKKATIATNRESDTRKTGSSTGGFGDGSGAVSFIRVARRNESEQKSSFGDM